MELRLKVVSKDINQLMWNSGKTLSTAESCSAGRIASALTIAAGSSHYFKGGLVSVSYTNLTLTTICSV